jgi:hypothetical protein
VKRCLAELAQAGVLVRYCDLTGGQGDASSREVIARLRDGWTTTLKSFAYEPLPAASFCRIRRRPGRAAAARRGVRRHGACGAADHAPL